MTAPEIIRILQRQDPKTYARIAFLARATTTEDEREATVSVLLVSAVRVMADTPTMEAIEELRDPARALAVRDELAIAGPRPS